MKTSSYSPQCCTDTCAIEPSLLLQAVLLASICFDKDQSCAHAYVMQAPATQVNSISYLHSEQPQNRAVIRRQLPSLKGLTQNIFKPGTTSGDNPHLSGLAQGIFKGPRRSACFTMLTESRDLLLVLCAWKAQHGLTALVRDLLQTHFSAECVQLCHLLLYLLLLRKC